MEFTVGSDYHASFPISSEPTVCSDLRGEPVLECPSFVVLWIRIPREILPPSLESQVSICLSLA